MAIRLAELPAISSGTTLPAADLKLGPARILEENRIVAGRVFEPHLRPFQLQAAGPANDLGQPIHFRPGFRPEGDPGLVRPMIRSFFKAKKLLRSFARTLVGAQFII